MGMDTIELVLTVEETFAISLPDDDAVQISTVGQLFEYVAAKTGDRNRTCLSAATFYRLRRALVSAWGVPRESIRPSVSVLPLLPLEGRRAAWNRLAEAMGLHLPPLERPARLASSIVCFSFAAAICAFGVALLHWGLGAAVATGFAALFAAALLADWLTLPWATEFAPQFVTAGELTTAIVAENYATLCADQRRGTREEIWQTLVAIITEQLRVAAEQITPEARFVQDLGAD